MKLSVTIKDRKNYRAINSFLHNFIDLTDDWLTEKDRQLHKRFFVKSKMKWHLDETKRQRKVNGAKSCANECQMYCPFVRNKRVKKGLQASYTECGEVKQYKFLDTVYTFSYTNNDQVYITEVSLR
jgi:hypothetical protein